MPRALNLAKFGLLVCLVPAIFTGCGRKSSPRAPENFAPGAVQFFSATPAADGITLSWAMPTQTAAGESLTSDSVVRFVVRKGLVVPDERTSLEDIGEIVVLEPKPSGAPTITTLGEEPAGGPASPKAEPKPASRIFRFTDKDLVKGTRYDYQVFGVNKDDVPGEAPKLVRVTFNGESSKVESVTLAGKNKSDQSFSY